MIDKNEAYKIKTAWDNKLKKEQYQSSYTKKIKNKEMKPYMMFYWQLLGFYSVEELNILYNNLDLHECWGSPQSPLNIDKKAFGIAYYLHAYKKIICNTLYEDLPLLIDTGDSFINKIISWRLALKK